MSAWKPASSQFPRTSAGIGSGRAKPHRSNPTSRAMLSISELWTTWADISTFNRLRLRRVPGDVLHAAAFVGHPRRGEEQIRQPVQVDEGLAVHLPPGQQ